MIANLVTTCLLALGVATGNVSSNSYKSGNAFNHEQKKPIQKATATETTNATFYLASELDVILTVNQTGRHEQYRKYYINKEDYQSANYNTDVYTIYNTTYELVADTNSTTTNYLLFTALALTTYFNFESEEITLTQEIYAINHTGQDNNLKLNLYRYEDTNNLNSFIDLTLTNTLFNTIYTELGNFEQKTNPEYASITIDPTSYIHTYGNVNEYTITDLAPNETRYIVLASELIQSGVQQAAREGDIKPQAITLLGTWNYTEINYEVVDIPNLMFTILTLPFSFYSTAFNLTIFPNTPYALNFGNLILTIIAALILLYIIKKVVK